jgi:predicted RNase H-like HicB family nuclease
MLVSYLVLLAILFMTQKSLGALLGLKYPVTLYQEESGGYTVEIKDLPGCISQGESTAEAIANIEEARRLWIETAYEHGDKIPKPKNLEEFSGRLVVRMPRSLHRNLADKAAKEGISLNQYILYLLSKG